MGTLDGALPGAAVRVLMGGVWGCLAGQAVYWRVLNEKADQAPLAQAVFIAGLGLLNAMRHALVSPEGNRQDRMSFLRGLILAGLPAYASVGAELMSIGSDIFPAVAGVARSLIIEHYPSLSTRLFCSDL